MTEALSVSAEVVAAIFGIEITVAAIIVQLAATRFNHQITTMFLRDWLNISVQSFFLATTLICIWIAADPQPSPQVVMLGMGCVTLALLLLLPYFGYVFTFISPLNVIKRIRRQAQRAIRRSRVNDTLDAINHLQDVARNAIEQKEGSIALACINALVELFEYYQTRRETMPPAWFNVAELGADSDFVSFEPAALAALDKSGLWFENKVLQQLLNMMWMSVPNLRVSAASLGIAIKRLAIANITNEALLELIIRAMNSFLRASINAGDARTTYHLLSQYLGLAEELLEKGANDSVLVVTSHIADYGGEAFDNGQAFILEVAAYDIAAIIRHAHQQPAAPVQALLDLFLSLDRDIRVDAQEGSLLGVRRAQIQVAAFFLEQQEDSIVQDILADLKSEPLERLEPMLNTLRQEDRALYWEYTPRGANFSYLAPHLRPYLDTIVQRLREFA